MINNTGPWPHHDDAYVRCPLGHYTHQFLACDVASSCWSPRPPAVCKASLAPLPPSFTCRDQVKHVPYTLVCDRRVDCIDSSDEDFCRLPSCRAEDFMCNNRKCIPSTKVCDGWEDCFHGEDEQQCYVRRVFLTSIPRPALVSLTDNGRLVVRPLFTNAARSTRQGGVCPETHFQCPGNNGNCLPLLLRCNRVFDCPGREDETGCDTCPGFYRCRASSVCLRRSELCDGHAHCPQHDDELLCNSTCPPACVCRGLAFFCTRNFATAMYPLLRFLDARGSGLSPTRLTNNVFLIHLSLADCGLRNLEGLSLKNLISLDVEGNRLSELSDIHLIGVPRLRELSVAGNPLSLVFSALGIESFRHLLKLDLSRVVLHELNVTALSAFPNLQILNLSHSHMQSVHGKGFTDLTQLRVIDLRGCPMTFLPRGIFQGLSHLQLVHAYSFKVCCPAVLPVNFNLRNCLTRSDEVSSCDDLLRESAYSICVFILSFLALTGNSVSFIFRICILKRENKLGFTKFVTHLSVADFLMGVYLALIGAADQVYRGTYVWNDVTWKRSAVCKAAGFLSLLSSEVSAVIMCLITIDRFLALCFPFSRLNFTPGSAQSVSILVWVAGVSLAAVPLLPVTSRWEFYSQTSICIPLPVTANEFGGHDYSFGIFIIFNFVLFVVISIGQLSIYVCVRANSMSVSNSTKKIKDLTIARRLITVAMSDFLCWFPIGVLGLMASNEVPVPGEVNVAVAIFVLPLNSAVNPCLYTINIIVERRSRAREQKLRALLLQINKRS